MTKKSDEMEKGTLVVRNTKKGFHVEIQFTKATGKQGSLTVTVWSPKDDTLNGTSCEFEREGGTLTKLVAHDGTVLYDKKKVAGNQNNPSGMSNGQDSFLPDATMLPQDTKAALNGVNPDNFLLKWQKGARHSDSESKNPFSFYHTNRGNVEYQIQPNFGNIDFASLAERERRNAEIHLGANNVRSFKYKTSWRLVQGLGMESVYEVSMTLHHVYGIPYIPATALKGVVRSWIISEYFEGKEENAIANKLFCDWFGCPGELVLERNKERTSFPSYYEKAYRGKLVFFDVYPTGAPNLVPDVMNPHYADYYQDNKNVKPPADYYNPVPIYFLTIEKTSFQFVFGGLDGSVLTETLGDKTIEDWTKEALMDHGIGAKTAVGYGYMS